MRLDGFHIHGFREFADIDVDLTKLEGRVIALCGPNGCGKSTLLELAVGGAMYRACPTRGSLASLAVTRDAFVESRINNGTPYTIRQLVDAQTGDGESLVKDENGAAVPGATDNAKVTEFDKWRKKNLLPSEVLYTSGFVPQGKQGIVDLKKGERKGMLLRAFGIERVERMAKLATERARTASGIVDTLRARLADKREHTPDIAVSRARLTAAETAAEQAAETARAARVALDRAKAAAEDALRAAEIAEQRRAVELRLGTDRGEAGGLEARIGNNRGLLGKAAEIRGAVEKVTQSKALAEDTLVKLGEVRQKRTEATGELSVHNATRNDATRRRQDAVERERRALERLREREAIEMAAANLPAQKEIVANSEADIARIEDEISHLQGRVLTHKDDRIGELRGSLTHIAEDTAQDEPRIYARRCLSADDNRATEEESLPLLMTEEKENLTKERSALAIVRNQLQEMERLAARAHDLVAADEDLRIAQEEINRTASEIEEAVERIKRATAATDDLSDEISGLEAVIGAANQVVETNEPLTKHADHLANAQARVDELTPQLDAARARITAAETELAALPDLQSEGVDLADYEQGLTTAEEGERTARDTVARAAKVVEDAVDGKERIEAIGIELRAAESELADWTRLSQDLGRDGLQAVEIGNAGPELNEQANALLRSCHGPRFTIEIDTNRTSADGKRVLEDLIITVHDAKKGTSHPAETYSGGERVIISEALSLAITALACRKNGIQRPTIVRDETGAALDPEEGQAYVAMLRRGAEVIDADRVLFVTHSAALQDLADSKLEIRDGGLQ